MPASGSRSRSGGGGGDGIPAESLRVPQLYSEDVVVGGHVGARGGERDRREYESERARGPVHVCRRARAYWSEREAPQFSRAFPITLRAKYYEPTSCTHSTSTPRLRSLHSLHYCVLFIAIWLIW